MPPDVASTGPPLARSSRLLSERRLEGLLCGALFVLFVIVARLSPGTFADDDIGRFFSAQVLFQQPEKLLGLWTRPAAMLLYALPSQLGYGTVEVTTALVATATCWLAIGVARRLGEPQPLWAGLLTGLQPFFVLLSFSVLTEPLAALLLVASLERALAGKWKQSALWAALLPLARLELLLVSVVWSVWYLRRRAWSALLILPLGILLWHLAGWMTGGDPLYLAHQVFVDRERVIAAPGFLHYARGTIFVLGPVVFFFAALGLVRAFAESEVRWIATAFVVMFVYYSWSAWQSGSLQSGGHLRHLVALAPLAGVLAARGQRVWLIERPSWKWTVLASAIVAVTGLFLAHGLRSRYLVADDVELWKPGIVGGLFLLGLARRLPGSERWGGPAQVGSNVFVVLALLGYFFVKEGPLPLNIEERIMHDVALVCHDAARNGRPVLCNHPSFFYFLGMNPYRDPDRHALKSKSLAEAPLGSLLVWEGHYGPERAGGVDLAALGDDLDLRVVRRFLAGDGFFAVLLEKVSEDGTGGAELAEGLYRNPGLSLRWDLPASGWRFALEPDGERLLGGYRADAAGPALDLQLDVERALREWNDSVSFGWQATKRMREVPGLQVGAAYQSEDQAWVWIPCRGERVDLLLGICVGPDRCTAVKLIGSGPPGALAHLEEEIPPLARGLHLEEAPLPDVESIGSAGPRAGTERP